MCAVDQKSYREKHISPTVPSSRCQPSCRSSRPTLASLEAASFHLRRGLSRSHLILLCHLRRSYLDQALLEYLSCQRTCPSGPSEPTPARTMPSPKRLFLKVLFLIHTTSHVPQPSVLSFVMERGCQCCPLETALLPLPEQEGSQAVYKAGSVANADSGGVGKHIPWSAYSCIQIVLAACLTCNLFAQ